MPMTGEQRAALLELAEWMANPFDGAREEFLEIGVVDVLMKHGGMSANELLELFDRTQEDGPKVHFG